MERQDLEAFVMERCQRSPWTLDLVISAFLEALHSHRRPSVCTPFPNSLFTKHGEKDFIAAETATQHFKDIGVNFSGVGTTVLSNSVNNVNPLSRLPDESLRLLQWLLKFRYDVQFVMDPKLEIPTLITERLYGSHRVKDLHMGLLPDYILKLQEIDTSATTAFEESRSQFGSVFAFHGTSAENLHSILRCGLLNLSHSNLQRNGAIFGSGIYLSTDPAVALGFCKSGKGWDYSYFGTNARYLLLCEVAKGDKVFCSDNSNLATSSKKVDQDLGTYIIVQNSDLVKIRFLFVYVEPSKSRVASQDLKEQLHSPTLLSSPRFKRINWCKMKIMLYAAILLATAFLNSQVFHQGVKYIRTMF